MLRRKIRSAYRRLVGRFTDWCEVSFAPVPTSVRMAK